MIVELVLLAAMGQAVEESYGEAQAAAKRTGQAQQVLYVFGDRHAPEVAVFMASLKAANIRVPHVVDVSACSATTQREIRRCITHDMDSPFLQTVHSRGAGYGPIWWEMAKIRPATYRTWVSRSVNPLRKRGYSGNSYSRGRRVFRRSGGG